MDSFFFSSGNLEMVQILVEKGADVNSATKLGYSAIHLALENLNNGKFEVLSVYVLRKLFIMISIVYDIVTISKEIVEILTDEGAQLDWKNFYGFTPLHLVSKNGNFERLRYKY